MARQSVNPQIALAIVQHGETGMLCLRLKPLHGADLMNFDLGAKLSRWNYFAMLVARCRFALDLINGLERIPRDQRIPGVSREACGYRTVVEQDWI